MRAGDILVTHTPILRWMEQTKQLAAEIGRAPDEHGAQVAQVRETDHAALPCAAGVRHPARVAHHMDEMEPLAQRLSQLEGRRQRAPTRF